MANDFLKQITADAPPKPPGKKIGRPLGAKTRPDAPSKLAAQARRSQTETFSDPPKTAPASGGARPDTEIFGETKLPPENELPPKSESDLPPDDESGRPEKNESKPEDHRAVSTMVWDSIVGLLCAFVGKFWLPRKYVADGARPEQGEIPYDEREMVITAFCRYFASIGMAAMSPLQELCMAIFVYATPRLRLTLEFLKMRFMKKAKPGAPQPAGGDPRVPKTEKTNPPGQTEQPEVKTETKAGDPAPNIGLEHLAAETRI